MLLLPTPHLADTGGWVADHLGDLLTGTPRRSGAFVGGQTAATAALASLDITGYANRRSLVDPPASRGASKLSPYIRHGLIDLPNVHDHHAVADARSSDRFAYRKELLWQDYSRQWYAVFGRQTQRGTVYDPGTADRGWDRPPWPSDMRCVEATVDELNRDGWLVNQTRMWLASQWTVRAGADWRDGEDEMFRHLLDGSRAANRQGWQWVVGAARNRRYGFSRHQVLRRAPAFCAECRLRERCPIASYPADAIGEMVSPKPEMRTDLFGPATRAHPDPFSAAATRSSPDGVWITAESLGDGDPALAAHRDLPVHFVFDEPLLRTLRLDGKRLVFLADCLADLATRRDVSIWRGRPIDLLGAGTFAVTHAPVPGFRSIADARPDAVVREPWPWLRPPTPALIARLGRTRFPTFRDWCRLTAPNR